MKDKKRINKVLEYIGEKEKVADIGCDHCYVLINGILKGKIHKGIGVEVVEGPLIQAKKNIIKNKLEDRIEVRLGNGLIPINIGETDICVIGGMGGPLIKDILEEDIDKAKSFKKLILQPMSGESDLRKFLLDNGWKIVDEDILIDDKIYLYIIAEINEEKTDINLSVDTLDLGDIIIAKKGIARDKYIKEKINKLEKILIGLEKATSNQSAKKLEIEKKINRWRKYIES